MHGESVNAIADELYGLTPGEFVPARDARVTEAKRAGDKELARAIGGFRRPTKSAWLVNLLSRHRGDELARLTELGALFQAAHREASAGKLHELSARRARLLGALRDAARTLAEHAGESAGTGTLDEVEATLAAAVADPAAADQVRAGRLVKPLSYADFDLFAIAPLPAETPATGPVGNDAAVDDATGNDATGNDAVAVRERARERERASLREALVSAERDRDRATERTARLRDELSGAENRLAEAEDTAADLRRRLAELEAPEH